MKFLTNLFNTKKKNESDVNSDADVFLEGSSHADVSKKINLKSRFFNAKQVLGNKAKESGAGIAYGELIERNAKIGRNNTVLVVLLAALVGKLVFFTDPVTIVTPPNQTEEFKITGNKASENYKTQWGLFFATMVGNINPKNIEFVIDYITKALAPSLQSKVSEQFKTMANLMATRGVDQTFVPSDIYYDPINDFVYVWGTKTTKLINVPNKSETSRWTYQMTIGVKNGIPRIAYFDNYSGSPNIKKVTVNGKEELKNIDSLPSGEDN
ncbi:TraE/TraK family type IV conjugative transfer system protein (plasmid) [Rahnella aceris]